jgi:hypothetical protein
MLNSTMAEPILNRPRIMPRIGQRVTAGVPKHVDVNLEREAGPFTDARLTSRLTASVVNGVTRSVSNT